MRIYLDSSVLVKRVAHESEHDAVETALASVAAAGHALITSTLAEVEVSRALRARLDDVEPRLIAQAARSAFDGVAVAPLTAAVMASARTIGPPVLRSLDAMHLASAVALDVTELWTFDARLAAAAEATGLVVVAPRGGK